MPLGDIAGEVVAGTLRFLARAFLEIFVELLVKGPGYVICRAFDEDVDPDGIRVVIFGALFWAVTGGGAYAAYAYLAR